MRIPGYWFLTYDVKRGTVSGTCSDGRSFVQPVFGSRGSAERGYNVLAWCQGFGASLTMCGDTWEMVEAG